MLVSPSFFEKLLYACTFSACKIFALLTLHKHTRGSVLVYISSKFKRSLVTKICTSDILHPFQYMLLTWWNRVLSSSSHHIWKCWCWGWNKISSVYAPHVTCLASRVTHHWTMKPCCWRLLQPSQIVFFRCHEVRPSLCGANRFFLRSLFSAHTLRRFPSHSINTGIVPIPAILLSYVSLNRSDALCSRGCQL